MVAPHPHTGLIFTRDLEFLFHCDSSWIPSTSIDVQELARFLTLSNALSLLASLGAVTRLLPIASSCEGFQVSSGVPVSFRGSSLLSDYTSGLGLFFLLCVWYFTDPIFRCKLDSDSKAPQETSLLRYLQSGGLYPELPSPWASFSFWPCSSFTSSREGLSLLTDGGVEVVLDCWHSTNLRLKARRQTWTTSPPPSLQVLPYVLQLSSALGPI